MTLEEVRDYYGLRYCGNVTRELMKTGSKIEDLIIRNDEIIGIWDKNNNIPIFENKTKVKYTCIVSGEECIVLFMHWKNKKLENKYLSPSVSRSRTLTNLNKTKIREKNIESFNGPNGDERRKKCARQMRNFNLNIWPEMLKSYTPEQRCNLANKKRQTFHNRSIEEQEKINQKKNIWQYMGEEEKNRLRKQITLTLLSKAPETSRKMKENWKNYSFEEKKIRLENLKSGWVKKKYENMDLYYQGTYEKNFLDTCIISGLIPKRGPNIEYYDPIEDKIRMYMIDYEVNNYLIEVKSLWIWKKHERINLLKKEAAETYAFENGFKAYILYIIDDIRREGFNIDQIKS